MSHLASFIISENMSLSCMGRRHQNNLLVDDRSHSNTMSEVHVSHVPDLDED